MNYAYLEFWPSVLFFAHPLENEDHLAAELNDKEHMTNFMMILDTVRRCKRHAYPHDPLRWFDDGYPEFLNSEEADIIKWIKGSRICDLITDSKNSVGYEADFVIFIGEGFSMAAHMSRCRGQYVHIQTKARTQ